MDFDAQKGSGYRPKSQGGTQLNKSSSRNSRTSQNQDPQQNITEATLRPCPATEEDDTILITQLPDDDISQDKDGENDQGWLEEQDSFESSMHEDLSNDGRDSGSEHVKADNGYDTDLEVNDEEFLNGPVEYDPSGIKDYVKECNRLGVIPCAYFERHVFDSNFIMKNHGLGPLGAKAIAKPLEFNTSIETINLEGNCIEANGAKYLSRVMKENSYVTELVLSENAIGSSGAKNICEMLKENSTIRTLDLSGNDFADEDGAYFLTLLENNSTLSHLYLSHNNFGFEAAKAFKDALSINESLRVLDLSWNHFRLAGACCLAEGIKENYGLKEFHVSMNGFAREGSKAMGAALKQNQCLEMLDISSNRITAEGALDIARALQSNSDLRLLKIGGNPISHVGALTLLTAIGKNDNTEMTCLHMEGVIVNDDFESLHEKINATRPLQVVHGGVMSKKTCIKICTKGRRGNELENNPMTKLRKFIDKANLRLVDLFKQFDKDNSWTVDREEFINGIKSSGIDMTDAEIDDLACRMDKDEDGMIDFGELVFADNEQREQKRLAEKLKLLQKDAPVEDDKESVSSGEKLLKMLDEEES